MDATIAGHKIQLTEMLREIENLRGEQAEAVADIITSKETAELNDMLAGISKDRISRELADMRQLREEMKAKRPRLQRTSPAPTPRCRRPSSSATPRRVRPATSSTL